MKRRSFIQASLATLGSAAVAPAAAEGAREVYELRSYSLATAKQPVLDRYLEKAFLPALKRYGIGPVGVFAEKPERDQVKVHVLAVHPSTDSIAALPGR